MYWGALAPLWEDAAITSIVIEAPDRVLAARHGGVTNDLTGVTFESAEDLADWTKMVALLGDARDTPGGTWSVTASDGTDIWVADTQDGPYIRIFRGSQRAATLDDLATLGAMSDDMVELLTQSVRTGSSILITGGPRSGRSTLVCALASAAIPVRRRIRAVAVLTGAPAGLRNLDIRHPDIAVVSPSFHRPLANLVARAFDAHAQTVCVDEMLDRDTAAVVLAARLVNRSGVIAVLRAEPNRATETLIDLSGSPEGDAHEGTFDITVEMVRLPDDRRIVGRLEARGLSPNGLIVVYTAVMPAESETGITFERQLMGDG
jgi:pilus assembly protein CpaF